MSGLRGQPPGRTGVLWLQHRLDLARRAAERLDQKLRVLRTEQASVALELERTGPAWERAYREACTWLERTALLCGEEALRPLAGQPSAEVRVTWTTSMGVTFPSHASCSFPALDPDEAPVPSAAFPEAREACRRALEAAVRHAVVSRAAAELDVEVRRTRVRLRAVEQRWAPRLETALEAARTELDEAEHAEGVRLRWARDVSGRVSREALR